MGANEIVKGLSMSLSKEQKAKRIQRAKDWAQTHPERRREIIKKWQRTHPDQVLDYYYRSEYGVSLEEVEKLRARQSNRCAICKKPFSKGRATNFNVDHNHKTKKVRGLLCHNCNVMLGHAKENVEILKLAVDYLQGDNVGRK